MKNELAKPESKKKRRPYPPKHREVLRRAARKRKPWKNSTGPRTESGKAASSQNALKDGMHTHDMAALRRVLRKQREFTSKLK